MRLSRLNGTGLRHAAVVLSVSAMDVRTRRSREPANDAIRLSGSNTGGASPKSEGLASGFLGL